MATATEIEDDEDTATDQFLDAGDEDGEDGEVEATASGGSDRGRASSYEDAERKFNATAERQLQKYRAFLDAKFNDRAAQLKLKVQNKLDEWAMAHVGTGQVHNPEAVAASIARQVQATEARLAAYRTQLASLASAGVDVSAIEATLNAAEAS